MQIEDKITHVHTDDSPDIEHLGHVDHIIITIAETVSYKRASAWVYWAAQKTDRWVSPAQVSDENGHTFHLFWAPTSNIQQGQAERTRALQQESEQLGMFPEANDMPLFSNTPIPESQAKGPKGMRK